MPRQPRLHIPGAIYHVTLRGNHRQAIFFAPAHRQLLNTLVAEVIERYGARVHAYCWMTNHIHLLVQVGDTPLGRIILRIASRYARTIQIQVATTGHLFERRYHAVLVDAQQYLMELLRYIHLNPVRSRLATSALDYPWSSHHAYLQRRTESWVTTDVALGMFHSDAATAIESYRRFVEQAPIGLRSPLEEVNRHDTRVLGDDDFLTRVRGEAWRPRSRRPLDDLIVEACQRFTISVEELRGPGARRHLTRARAWIAHEALSGRVASLSAVARALNRGESSLRECVKRHHPA